MINKNYAKIIKQFAVNSHQLAVISYQQTQYKKTG